MFLRKESLIIKPVSIENDMFRRFEVLRSESKQVLRSESKDDGRFVIPQKKVFRSITWQVSYLLPGEF